MTTTLERRLRRELEGEVYFDDFTRGLYSTDASIYQIRPRGVVVPRSPQDVARTVELAAEAGVPVTPRGGGTSQGGQTVGPGLVVDASKFLCGILAVDPEARTARVQPGVVLDHLNRALAPRGLFFPVDVATASRATLGGMAGNNSAGARSIRYGHTVEHVRGIEAVMADGSSAWFSASPAPGQGADGRPASASVDRGLGGQARVEAVRARVARIYEREADELARRIPRVPRHVAGYNLHRMARATPNLADVLVGSEGTLAFFTALELELQALPGARALGVCHFPSLGHALDAVQHLVRLDPTAVELVDRALLDLARRNRDFEAALQTFVRGTPEALLLVEFSGTSAEATARQLDRLEERLGDLGYPGSVVRAESAGSQARIWEVRKAGLNIAMSMKGDTKPIAFIEDCAIPLERLVEWEERLNAVFRRHGTTAIWYAHASVGLLHVRPALDLKSADDVGRMRAITEEAFEIVRDLGGSHSGEHGDGRIRSEFIEPMLGSRLARAFEDVKEAFDPNGVYNPGSIVQPPPMDDRSLFRYGPDYAPISLPTVLDWQAWDGLTGAVEMCNNNGACRKLDPGVMCPSYRVTRDERHATRGRANGLRLALTGQLGPDGLTSDAMYEAMDLCIGCKGCRRECPTGVDMARMKIEFLHAYRARHRLPLRDRLFAYLPRHARWAWRARRLLALRERSALVAGVGEALTGLAARRPLPAWSPTPFLHPGGLELGEGPPLTLFVDTFSTWFEPEIATDAARVLAAAGFRVRVPAWPGRQRPLCCGRTFLSAGLVDEARHEMRRLLEVLVPLAADGPIVGLEPSCLLTLRDELPALFPGAETERVSGAALLLEELLETHVPGRALKLRNPGCAGLRVHGHCHEKAFAAVGGLEAVLRRVPDSEVDVIASGCCGMAGSFGYEAEHYALSLAMGELELFPAVRETPADWLLIANGTSCRRQLADATGREALHLAQVLARSLPSDDGLALPTSSPGSGGSALPP